MSSGLQALQFTAGFGLSSLPKCRAWACHLRVWGLEFRVLEFLGLGV